MFKLAVHWLDVVAEVLICGPLKIKPELLLQTVIRVSCCCWVKVAAMTTAAAPGSGPSCDLGHTLPFPARARRC